MCRELKASWYHRSSCPKREKINKKGTSPNIPLHPNANAMLSNEQHDDNVGETNSLPTRLLLLSVRLEAV